MAHERRPWIRVVLLALVVWCTGAVCDAVQQLEHDVGEKFVSNARHDAIAIESAVRSYRLKTGRTPASLRDLTIPDTSGARALDELPHDPWGHPYELRDDGAAEREIVVSAGPNGRFGDGDDVSKHTRMQR